MIPKIKKIKHYKGFIFRATQELRDITRQLDPEAFEECMKIFELKFHRYGTGGGDWTDLEVVDSLCKTKGSGVGKFSCVCLMPAAKYHYAVETTNEQLLNFFARLDELKVFL